MSNVLTHLEKAISNTERRNRGVLEFIAHFRDGDNSSVLNRWENWLQVELLFSLNELKVHDKDLYHEHGFSYKKNKSKSAVKSKQGFTTGAIDMAFRPWGGDAGLIAGVELKVKENPTPAIRGGLHDLLKPQAFKTSGWNFRAIYSMAVFANDLEKIEKSKYVKFLGEHPGPGEFPHLKTMGKIVPFGKHFRIALIGWETSPRSGTTKTFYKEYSLWVKAMLNKAKERKLTINKST